MAIIQFIDFKNLKATCKSILQEKFTAEDWKKETDFSLLSLVSGTDITGHYFRAIKGGKSGLEEPTWKTDILEDTTDGTIIWREEQPLYILEEEPSDFSFPSLIIKEPRVVSDILRSQGVQRQNDIEIDLELTTYRGIPQKSYRKIVEQAYHYKNIIEDTLRKDTSLSEFPGIVWGQTAGYSIITDELPHLFKIKIIWGIRILTKKEG